MKIFEVIKKNKITIIVVILLFGVLKNYDAIKQYIISLF